MVLTTLLITALAGNAKQQTVCRSVSPTAFGVHIPDEGYPRIGSLNKFVSCEFSVEKAPNQLICMTLLPGLGGLVGVLCY